jgi:hypothetical protein
MTNVCDVATGNGRNEEVSPHDVSVEISAQSSSLQMERIIPVRSLPLVCTTCCCMSSLTYILNNGKNKETQLLVKKRVELGGQRRIKRDKKKVTFFTNATICYSFSSV